MSVTTTQTATAPTAQLASLSLTGTAAEHAPALAKADGSDWTLSAEPLKKTGALDGYKQRVKLAVISAVPRE